MILLVQPAVLKTLHVPRTEMHQKFNLTICNSIFQNIYFVYLVKNHWPPEDFIAVVSLSLYFPQNLLPLTFPLPLYTNDPVRGFLIAITSYMQNFSLLPMAHKIDLWYSGPD